MMHREACPACGSPSVAPRALTCRSGEGTLHAYARCAACGALYLAECPPREQILAFYTADHYGTGETKFPPWLEVLRCHSNRLRARSAEALLPGPGARVLDVGCGSGQFLREMGALGHALYGTELAGPAWERASRVPGIHLLMGDLQPTSFPGATFDVITLWHVLEHLPDPAATLALCRRFLKADGHLIVEVPNAGSGQAVLFGASWLHLDPPRHLVQFTSGALVRLLERSGFRVERRGTLSLQMGVVGVVQSALNTVVQPRDLVYRRLLTRGGCPAAPLAARLSVALALPLLPLAVGLALAEAALGAGAVLRVVCRPQLGRSIPAGESLSRNGLSESDLSTMR